VQPDWCGDSTSAAENSHSHEKRERFSYNGVNFVGIVNVFLKSKIILLDSTDQSSEIGMEVTTLCGGPS